jgi:hypothetical protein
MMVMLSQQMGQQRRCGGKGHLLMFGTLEISADGQGWKVTTCWMKVMLMWQVAQQHR